MCYLKYFLAYLYNECRALRPRCLRLLCQQDTQLRSSVTRDLNDHERDDSEHVPIIQRRCRAHLCRFELKAEVFPHQLNAMRYPPKPLSGQACPSKALLNREPTTKKPLFQLRPPAYRDFCREAKGQVSRAKCPNRSPPWQDDSRPI